MFRKFRSLTPNEPLRLNNHRRPITRREFIAQGFLSGAGTLIGGSIFSLFANPRAAMAALSPDLLALRSSCNIRVAGANKIPFICFDLAGGANIAGSNVLVGGRGGQEDFLTTAGYSKLGLPGDRIPSIMNVTTGSSDIANWVWHFIPKAPCCEAFWARQLLRAAISTAQFSLRFPIMTRATTRTTQCMELIAPVPTANY
jgi:hypothetical protein